MFPEAWGANSTLPALKTVTLKPGNSGLCGTLPSVDFSVLYSEGSVTYPVSSSLGTCAREPNLYALNPIPVSSSLDTRAREIIPLDRRPYYREPQHPCVWIDPRKPLIQKPPVACFL